MGKTAIDDIFHNVSQQEFTILINLTILINSFYNYMIDLFFCKYLVMI